MARARREGCLLLLLLLCDRVPGGEGWGTPILRRTRRRKKRQKTLDEMYVKPERQSLNPLAFSFHSSVLLVSSQRTHSTVQTHRTRRLRGRLFIFRSNYIALITTPTFHDAAIALTCPPTHFTDLPSPSPSPSPPPHHRRRRRRRRSPNTRKIRTAQHSLLVFLFVREDEGEKRRKE